MILRGGAKGDEPKEGAQHPDELPMPIHSKRSRKRRRRRQRIDEARVQEEERKIQERAKSNYETFYGIPKGCCTIEQVRSSSAGISGWSGASLTDINQEGAEEGMTNFGPGGRNISEGRRGEGQGEAKEGMSQVGPGGESISEGPRGESQGRAKESTKQSAEDGGKISMLRTREPEGICALTDDGTETWEEIDFPVDSGATETVVSDEMLTTIETVEG